MLQMKDVNTDTIDAGSGLPLKFVIGFTLSIILTAFSLWATFYSDFSMRILPAVLAMLTFFQAIRQLLYVHSYQSKN